MTPDRMVRPSQRDPDIDPINALLRNHVRVCRYPQAARTLVFCHGFGTDQAYWSEVTDAFRLKHRTATSDNVNRERPICLRRKFLGRPICLRQGIGRHPRTGLAECRTGGPFDGRNVPDSGGLRRARQCRKACSNRNFTAISPWGWLQGQLFSSGSGSIF